ncbi:MAG: plasmid mobilization relaxosome protein MobC, partial [Oscillospiraceae bacterium]|nr:plasmid mobilization relaxosome protein MobC [Oscillospiraceae bacterium]
LWVDLASIDFVGTKSEIERSIMNRDNFIKIRVSADEMSAIKQRAEAANMSISSFLRNLALNGKIILYDTENIYRFNQLMRAIGTNINQIAMVVNSEKKVFKGDIDLLRREVEKISGEFHSYIFPLKSQEV